MLMFFAVSLLASTVGSICGIGGGVIIKPVLDLLHAETVSAISFLSGCTVLSMSGCSVGKSLLVKAHSIDLSIGTPLAIGAAAGGLAGNQLFAAVGRLVQAPNQVGAVQAACLAAVTVGTLLYTLNKDRISTYQVRNYAACFFIGLALGCMSSFLGIGGGPINLVVLYYFFSMDTKTAAANSLYIIFFSQLCNLCAALLTNTVPSIRWPMLIFMVAGGICGGIIGRKLNNRIEEKTVERLFIALMAGIVCISIFNTWRYAVQ